MSLALVLNSEDVACLMPLKESQATWCLVTSDGPEMRWEKMRALLSMYLCFTAGSWEQLENKVQGTLSVLIYMPWADHWLLGGQHSIDARGHYSLRTAWQTRGLGDKLVGVETDLWALWKFRYQGFLDKASQKCTWFWSLKKKLNHLSSNSATSDWITWQHRNVWSELSLDVTHYLPSA